MGGAGFAVQRDAKHIYTAKAAEKEGSKVFLRANCSALRCYQYLYDSWHLDTCHTFEVHVILLDTCHTMRYMSYYEIHVILSGRDILLDTRHTIRNMSLY